MKAPQILKKAVTLMNNGGRHWTKGTLKRGHATYCSIGGINAAAGRPQSYGSNGVVVTAAKRELAAAITGDDRYVTKAGRPGYTISDVEDVIISFNDRAETTWDDIKRVFSKATRAARKRS
jgi:hypothetical protein